MKTFRDLKNKIKSNNNNNINNNFNDNNNNKTDFNIQSSPNLNNNFNNINLQFKENNFNINSIYSNILDIDWNTIIEIEKLEYGNSMILLLVTFLNKDKQSYNKVIIKSSPTIAQEVYASVLQSFLKLPIPETRLLGFTSKEFTEMSESLLQHCLQQNDQLLHEFIKFELLEKSFFLIMEYKCGGKKFNELNHKDYFAGKLGREKFKQLGKIMAFDIFCNNFCKSTSSNDSIYFSNIICYDTPDKNGWYFSLINSNIICLNNSSFTIGYRDHMNKLKILLFSIFQNPTTESIQIKLMRDHLLKLNIKLPKSSSVNIQKGITKGVKLIVNFLNYPILETTKDKVKNIVKIDSSNNIWKRGIDSIHCPFLLDILLVFDIEFLNYKDKDYFLKI